VLSCTVTKAAEPPVLDIVIKTIRSNHYEAVETADAEELLLNWYRGYEVELDSNAVESIKKQCVQRPISVGNVLPVMVDTEAGDYIPFVIADGHPGGVSVIGDQTKVRINSR
jgi:hypothetical protein